MTELRQEVNGSPTSTHLIAATLFATPLATVDVFIDEVPRKSWYFTHEGILS